MKAKLPVICTLELTPEQFESALANALDLTKVKEYHTAIGFRLREMDGLFTGREISMQYNEGVTKIIAVFKRA